MVAQRSANDTTRQNIIDEINQGCRAIHAENPLLLKFRRSILDQEKDYPPPTPILCLTQGGETLPFLTLQSFSLWQGKQKSKKTTLLAMVIAAYLGGAIEANEIKIHGVGDGVVIVFDCEQGESYGARTMSLILRLAGTSSTKRLIYCNLREFSPTERLNIITEAISDTPEVKLIIIDGLVDLLNDFMDAAEGHALITKILSLCSSHDIHIAGVLHQNKADKNARAHIGTIASQKCEMEISAEVDTTDKAKSIITCVNSRGIPFETFAIKWEKGCLPRIAPEWDINKSDDKISKNYEQSKEVAEAVFKPFVALSHTEAISGIMKTTLKSESTAKRLMKDYLGWGIIEKGIDGNYRINSGKGSRVHVGSKEGS